MKVNVNASYEWRTDSVNLTIEWCEKSLRMFLHAVMSIYVGFMLSLVEIVCAGLDLRFQLGRCFHHQSQHFSIRLSLAVRAFDPQRDLSRHLSR